jgi:hypothetical protein
MTRAIDVKIIVDNEPLCIRVFEHSSHMKDVDAANRNGADYKLSGCGTDMGFALVYSLGMLIHNDGYYFDHRWL